MNPQLQIKIDRAIKLLRSIQDMKPDEQIEIAYSGGKDSDVILQLAKEAGINYRAIYKNTTIDPPGTIKHVEEMGVEIMRPDITFFQLIAKKGMPSRFTRFCCYHLKEYPVLKTSVIGIRKEESTRRAMRYKEPTLCRIYPHGKHVEQIMPILDWTTEDVREFIEDRGIKLAPVYYLPSGTIDYSRRLGCMCCPMANNKQRISEFVNHPLLVRTWINAIERFWDSHPNARIRYWFSDVYEYFWVNLFFRSIHCTILNKDSQHQENYKEKLEEYFKIKL